MADILAGEFCEGSIEVDGEVLYCDLPATQRARGEEDSFGVEWIYFCSTCADEFYDECNRLRQVEADQRRNGPCQRCKNSDGDVAAYFPSDQPSYEGPVWFCRKCRDRFDRDDLVELCGYEVRMDHAECRCGEHIPEPVEDYEEYSESEGWPYEVSA